MARYERDLQDAILSSTYTYRSYDGEHCVGEIDSLGDFWYDLEELDVEGFGHLEVVETEGGEGQGDHAHIVFKLTDADGNESFYKFDGFYSSYDGVDWDGSDLYSVTPRQKTITVYE